MLGIHGVGRDKADYYLSDLARELPVAGPGRWAGTAAGGLGLAGPVDPDELPASARGPASRTGVVLGSGRISVAAFDLTFSAPKSASVLFALGGADAASAVVAAHVQAVAGSLSYLEQHGITAARRGGAARVVLPTTGAVAAVFTHGVSRNGDPHLHSHVVVANLVHGADGRWGACDRRGIEAHRMAASAVYEAHLRAGLVSALGVRWAGAPGRSAEVAGVGPELLGEFSTRGADIRRHMHEAGARSGRGARVAWAATRPAKAPSAPFAELAARWRRRAAAVGARLELERRTRREARTPGRARRAPLRRRDLPHGPRRGAPARCRGRVRRGGPRRRQRPCRGDAWWTNGCHRGRSGWRSRSSQRRTVVPANHHLRALGPRPVDPDDHAVWRGAAPRHRRLPGPVGPRAGGGAARRAAQPGRAARRPSGRSRPHRAGGGGGAGPARVARAR